MPELTIAEDTVILIGSQHTLIYRPREITVDDGTTVRHESLGGGLSSVWARDLGGYFVEVAYLGDGPGGGELVLSATAENESIVALGDLYSPELPAVVYPSWAQSVDLAFGLLTESTRVLTSSGEVNRAEIEDFGQRLITATSA